MKHHDSLHRQGNMIPIAAYLALFAAASALALPPTLFAQDRDSTAALPDSTSQGSLIAGKLLMQAARNGIPVIVTEGDTEQVLAANDAPDAEPYRVRLSTDHLVRLHRLARYGDWTSPTVDTTLPIVETTVEWSSDTTVYGVTRIAAGFWHRRLWIVHEQTENADAGIIALFLRFVW